MLIPCADLPSQLEVIPKGFWVGGEVHDVKLTLWMRRTWGYSEMARVGIMWFLTMSALELGEMTLCQSNMTIEHPWWINAVLMGKLLNWTGYCQASHVWLPDVIYFVYFVCWILLLLQQEWGHQHYHICFDGQVEVTGVPWIACTCTPKFSHQLLGWFTCSFLHSDMSRSHNLRLKWSEHGVYTPFLHSMANLIGTWW